MFHKRWLRYYLRTTMAAQQWVTIRNPLPEPDISISNTSPSANGWKVISCSWNVTIPLSTCWTIWQKTYIPSSSIVMPTSFWVTFLDVFSSIWLHSGHLYQSYGGHQPLCPTNIHYSHNRSCGARTCSHLVRLSQQPMNYCHWTWTVQSTLHFLIMLSLCSRDIR